MAFIGATSPQLVIYSRIYEVCLQFSVRGHSRLSSVSITSRTSLKTFSGVRNIEQADFDFTWSVIVVRQLVCVSGGLRTIYVKLELTLVSGHVEWMDLLYVHEN